MYCNTLPQDQLHQILSEQKTLYPKTNATKYFYLDYVDHNMLSHSVMCIVTWARDAHDMLHPIPLWSCLWSNLPCELIFLFFWSSIVIIYYFSVRLLNDMYHNALLGHVLLGSEILRNSQFF